MSIDLGRGGGYMYQWQSAILLALNYLMNGNDFPYELDELVHEFLGQVKSVYLEEIDTISLESEDIEQSILPILRELGLISNDKISVFEDINLTSGNRAICIQVKTKKEEENRWEPRDDSIKKAFYRFYQKLDSWEMGQDNIPFRFVFMSNQQFGPKISLLKQAISKNTIENSNEAKTLFQSLQKYAKKFNKEQHERENDLIWGKFVCLLRNLTFIKSLELAEVERSIKRRLEILKIKNFEQTYNNLFTAFVKRSVIAGGSDITLAELHNIVPDLFAGRLYDYVKNQSKRAVAHYVFQQSHKIPLPPIRNTCGKVVQKIEKILNMNRNALKEDEAFILLIAACLPSFLRLNPGFNSSGGNITHTNILEFAENVAQNLPEYDEADKIIRDMAFQIRIVANSYNGFEIDNQKYNDSDVQGITLRIRMLCALLHLAKLLNLDEHCDPAPPPDIARLSPGERLYWWRQAYIRSVNIEPSIESSTESSKMKLSIIIPKELEKDYKLLLIEPLIEELSKCISLYNDIILSDLILRKTDIRSEENIFVISDSEWKYIETEHFARHANELYQKAILLERARESWLKTHIDDAKRMAAEHRSGTAAQRFAAISDRFEKGADIAQARYYAIESAKLFSKNGDKSEAAKQYLRSAKIWLYNSHTPDRTSDELKQAHLLAEELKNPELQAHVFLVQAFTDFAALRFDDAQSNLKKAQRTISAIHDERSQIEILRDYTLQAATFALVSGQKDISYAVLEHALANFPATDRIERFDVFQKLLCVGTEYGDWEKADYAYEQAQICIQDSPEPLRQGVLVMHYGACLSRRGKPKESVKAYQNALELLEAHADAYTLGIAYQNMQYMLQLDVAETATDFIEHETRRIDLFHKTQCESKGYFHELQAVAFLSKKDYLKVRQNIALALYHYWNDGVWLGIQDTYRILSDLNAEEGALAEALFEAIRGNDLKAVEKLSQKLRDTTDSEILSTIVEKLIIKRAAVRERHLPIKAIGILSDVIPPSLLQPVTNHLVNILQEIEDESQNRQIRQFAAEALRQIVPQFNAEQTNAIVKIVLEQLKRQQSFKAIEELLKLLGKFFALEDPQVDTGLYSVVVDSMLSVSPEDLFYHQSKRVVTYLARSPQAQAELKQQVVAYLQKGTDQLDSLCLLGHLNVQIAETQLREAFEQIFQAVNRKPEERGFSFGTIRPRMVNNFHESLRSSLHDMLIDGLLGTVINEHNLPYIRREAVWALSELPIIVLSNRANEIVDYLLMGAEETPPQNSSFKLFDLGSSELVRESCLYAMGKLYSSVDADQQKRITDCLITTSRDDSVLVRRGVAIALYSIEGNPILPQRLLLALIILLHDPDIKTRKDACAASGHLVSSGLAGTFTEDILELLCHFAEAESPVDVRVGVAIGLSEVVQSGQRDGELLRRVGKTLEDLSHDVSFRVRYHACTEEMKTTN